MDMAGLPKENAEDAPLQRYINDRRFSRHQLSGPSHRIALPRVYGKE